MADPGARDVPQSSVLICMKFLAKIMSNNRLAPLWEILDQPRLYSVPYHYWYHAQIYMAAGYRIFSLRLYHTLSYDKQTTSYPTPNIPTHGHMWVCKTHVPQ